MKVLSEKNLERAKNLLKNSGEKFRALKAQNAEYNRKMLEWGKFNLLVGVEQSDDIERSKIKQVDSGFNHVLAKIAAKNGIAIGIDLESLRKLDKKNKALLLEKLIQNVKICRKAECKIKILNCKDEKDTFDFLVSLGADSKRAKESLN